MTAVDAAGLDGEDDRWIAVELGMRDHGDDGEPETWNAQAFEEDESGGPIIVTADDVLGHATVYRAHFAQDWLERLDTVDSDLCEVAEAFVDGDRIAEVDPDADLAISLVVVYDVEVKEAARGHRIGHKIVQALARAFPTDIIALLPARVSTGDDGQLYDDEVKHQALKRYWGSMGFVPIPDTHVMMLPLYARN